MNFKSLIISNLPEGDKFLRIYSRSERFSVVEVERGGELIPCALTKENIRDYFSTFPYIELPAESSCNDVYKLLSKKFDLGLVRGIDYFLDTPVALSDTPVYLELPILQDSYGYYGSIGVMVSLEGSSLNGELEDKDLFEIPQDIIYASPKLRTVFTSKVFTLEGKNLFGDNRLSTEFIAVLMAVVETEFDEFFSRDVQQGLLKGKVVGLINDGLSDVLLFRFPNGHEYFIRFMSQKDDLPVVELNPQEEDILLVDDSQELPAGEEEMVSENPGGKEGDFNISDYEVIAYIPSLTPQENELPEDRSSVMIE